jgi:RNA polymerase sigma-70 factor (ECF subfamily)
VLRRLPVGSVDAALVAALKSGQPDAPAALVEHYGRYVERLVARVMGFDPEVPDLVQEVFVRALECVHDLKDPYSLKGWLGSLAIFTARAWMKRRRFRRRWLRFLPPQELPETASISASPEANETLARTYQALDKLPPDERIAFALRFVDGMQLADVASMVGVSLATIKRRLVRAERRFLDTARRDPLLRERIAMGERWRDR